VDLIIMYRELSSCEIALLFSKGDGKMRTKAIMMTSVLLMSSGCVEATKISNQKWNYYTSNVPDLNSVDVKAYVGNQKKIFDSIVESTGRPESKDGEEFKQVVTAGIGYVNLRCERYIDALFFLNRVRETTSREIQYAGAATSATLALVKASKELIGLAPLGFGLLDQTVNNVGKGLLFDLDPSVVRTLVRKQQVAFVKSLSARYTNRVDAMLVIQDYAAICLPTSIESEVKSAIANSEYKPNTILSPISAPAPAPAPAPTATPTVDTGTPNGRPAPEQIKPLLN